MADRGETARNTGTLHFVFAISSIALLASLVWMLYADYDREWKTWQKLARRVELDRTHTALLNVNEPATPGGRTLEQLVQDAEREVQEMESKLKRDDREYLQWTKELTVKNGQIFAAEQAKKTAKALEDAERYSIEMARRDRKDPNFGAEALTAAAEKTRLALVRYESAVADARALEEKINARTESLSARKNDLLTKRRELDRLRKRRDDLTSFVKQGLMNAPGLDFIQPTLTIKKQVLNGLNFDLNFTSKKRIDMCQTCHVNIDVPGYDTHEIPRYEGENFAERIEGWVPVSDVMAGATKLAEKGKPIGKDAAREIASRREIQSVLVDLPQPLKSHPKLDLYMSAASPHPIESFGCTVCHRGSGESVGFVTADHSPETFHREIMQSALSEVEKFKKNEAKTEHVRKQWREKYHWHKQHHWDYPMLPVSATEASCLQCHTSSLETIRDAAPTLYKGWRLIEEKGCYTCHKIGTWREQRKPGPTLLTLGEKLQKDFTYSWISNPKAFRPTTRMPQIFHLENAVRVDEPRAPAMADVRARVTAELRGRDRAAVDAEVKARFEAESKAFTEAAAARASVKSAYESLGRVYETSVWDDVAIHGIVTFLYTNSEPFEVPEPPVKGDAEKGKGQFQLAGCLGCHEMGSGASQVGKPNPYGAFGPNLEGIGSKVTEKWLYQWLKEPHDWWSETRMPNLRLADDEAANIAAYLASQKKEGWTPVVPPLDPAVLESQALTFLGNKVSQADARRYLQLLREGNFESLRADGVMDPRLLPKKPVRGNDALAYYVGERWISRQGCYSCHSIGGLLDAQPIGVELTEWGSKEVEKLDFGLLEHTWDVTKRFGEGNHPYMNVPGTPSQGRELSGGLNHESRSQWLEQKLRAPRSYDRGRDKAPLDTWRMPYFDLTEEEIQAISVFVMGLVKEGDVSPTRMMALTPQQQALEVGWYQIRQNNCAGCHPFEMETVEFKGDKGLVRAVGIVTVDEEGDDTISMQLWEPAPDINLKDPDETKVAAIATIERDRIVQRIPMVGGGIWKSLMAYYEERENKGGVEALPLIPPVLAQEGDKVRPPWLFGFLKQPHTVRPIVKVHMPNFHLTDEEAHAIAVYFPERQRQTYPRRLALDARHQLKLTREELASRARLGSPDKVRLLEAGITPNRETLDRLTAFAKEQNVVSPQPPELLEHVVEREPAYRSAREAEHEGYFSKAAEIAAQPTAGNCYSCHFRGDVKPTGQEDSWAPDLSRVRDRLRPDWTYRWISDPQSLSPGTKMPAPAEYPAILDAPRPVQMRALTDLLFNWDVLQSLVMPPPKVAAAPGKEESQGSGAAAK